MDPEANLKEQLELANSILNPPEDYADDHPDAEEHPCQCFSGDAERLAELVLALNEWITGGGFLPSSWKRD